MTVVNTKDQRIGDTPDYLERRPMFQLSEAEIIKVIKSRASEEKVMPKMEFIVRMLEGTMDNAQYDKSLRPGLMLAIELVKLYGKTIAPGMQGHPFDNAFDNVKDCFRKVETRFAKLEPSIEAPIKMVRDKTGGLKIEIVE